MPLRSAFPNAMHEARVRQQLSQSAVQGPGQGNALAGAAPDELQIESSQQVYVLGLDQVCAGVDLGSAIPIGWRYLLRQGDTVVAAAQTVTDAGGQAEFASFNRGPYVNSTRQAIWTAEEYATGGAGAGEDWEARILHVPALHAMALWLHTDAEPVDVVLPLHPAPIGIDVGRRYTARDYLAALRKIAESVEASSASDTTGS